MWILFNLIPNLNLKPISKQYFSHIIGLGLEQDKDQGNDKHQTKTKTMKKVLLDKGQNKDQIKTISKNETMLRPSTLLNSRPDQTHYWTKTKSIHRS